MGRRGDEGEAEPPIVAGYANYVEVGHNAYEVLLDFGQLSPEGERARIHTRIIMGPVFAKALLRTLRESLTHYQETYGPIEDDGGLPTDDGL